MNGIRVVAWPPPAPVETVTSDGCVAPPLYRDFSGLLAGDVPPIPPPSLRASRRRKGPKELSFPMKLYGLLEDCQSQGLDYIVSWQEHGRSFMVADAKQFAARVMPGYFRQSKFHSFQRQLNLYGFKRLGSGPDKGCYYHEMFLRDKRFLAEQMKRTKVKGVGRQPYFPETEPDFYKMPSLPPLGWTKRLEKDLAGGKRTGSLSSHALMMNHISSSSSRTGNTTTLQTAMPSSKPHTIPTSEMGTVVSSEYTSEEDDTSYEGASSFGDDPSVIPVDFYKRSSAPGNSSSSSSGGVELETAAAMRRNKPTTMPTIAPAVIIRRGGYYPTTGADDVARSAQMILQEVKGHRQHVPVVHQVAISSIKSTSPNEGELIMGTLNAVASYYAFPKAAPIH